MSSSAPQDMSITVRRTRTKASLSAALEVERTDLCDTGHAVLRPAAHLPHHFTTQRM